MARKDQVIAPHPDGADWLLIRPSGAPIDGQRRSHLNKAHKQNMVNLARFLTFCVGFYVGLDADHMTLCVARGIPALEAIASGLGASGMLAKLHFQARRSRASSSPPAEFPRHLCFCQRLLPTCPAPVKRTNQSGRGERVWINSCADPQLPPFEQNHNLWTLNLFSTRTALLPGV